MGMNSVIARLEGDWNFVADFLNNADSAIAGFGLSSGESAALRSGDATALQSLGLDQGSIATGLSTLHSRRCIGK